MEGNFALMKEFDVTETSTSHETATDREDIGLRDRQVDRRILLSD